MVLLAGVCEMGRGGAMVCKLGSNWHNGRIPGTAGTALKGVSGLVMVD